MAIISIPTSIGGINIPGGIFDGPLSDLDKGGGTFTYQYPRDLGSATKAHSVNFTIYEIKEVELKVVTNFLKEQVQTVTNFGKDASVAGTLDTISAGSKTVYEIGTSSFGDVVSTFKEKGGLQGAADVVNKSIDAGAAGLVTGIDLIDKASGFLKQPEGKLIGHIGLYMPEAFNLSAAISYDDSTTVASALGTVPLLGNMIKSATNFIGDGTSGGEQTAVQVALNRAGYVFNPQKQVLFQGVEFRHFSMSFTFTPYSQAEAEQIKQIIQKFRMYAAPKRNEINKNMFWVPPALFEIDFRMNGTHNKHLPKLQKCVINNIDVNYAPNGWTTHTDGAPIQTILTLEFQETSLIGRDEIIEGY